MSDKDTIYRQDAIKVARDWYEGLICGSFKGLEKRLRALPSAQPEIIRCRDCVWHNKDINQCDRQVCAVMYADNFCNYGERRGEQE